MPLAHLPQQRQCAGLARHRDRAGPVLGLQPGRDPGQDEIAGEGALLGVPGQDRAGRLQPPGIGAACGCPAPQSPGVDQPFRPGILRLCRSPADGALADAQLLPPDAAGRPPGNRSRHVTCPHVTKRPVDLAAIGHPQRHHRLGKVRRALPATSPDQGNRPPRAPDDIAARPALALAKQKKRAKESIRKTGYSSHIMAKRRYAEHGSRRRRASITRTATCPQAGQTGLMRVRMRRRAAK